MDLYLFSRITSEFYPFCRKVVDPKCTIFSKSKKSNRKETAQLSNQLMSALKKKLIKIPLMKLSDTVLTVFLMIMLSGKVVLEKFGKFTANELMEFTL